MRLIAVLIILTYGTVLSAGSFTWAASIFLWTNIFQPLGFAYSHGAFPIAIYVFILLIVSFCLNVARGAFKPQMNRMIFFSCLFIVWSIISSCFSPFQEVVWSELFGILKYVLPLMLITTGLANFKDVVIVSITLVLSVGIWSAQAGVKGLLSGVTSNMAINHGQMSDNNDFMAATLGILPFLLFFPQIYHGRHGKYVKTISYIMFLLSLIAIVFSNSRGATVGVVGLWVFYIFFISQRKARDFWVMTGIMVLSLFLVPDSFWDRVKTIDLSLHQQSESSASSRLHLMKSGLRCALDNPVFGVGPNSWIYIAEEYAGKDSEPHSAYIKLAAEIGFPGLLIYIYFLFDTIRRLLRARHRFVGIGAREKALVSTMLAMSLVGMVIPFMFLNHPYSEFLWAWLGVSCAFLAQDTFT